MLPPTKKLGDITFEGKDIPTQPAKYDRLALDRKNRILLLSIVAESQYIKAIRAILNGGAKCSIQASGGKVQVPDKEYDYPKTPGNCFATSESYDVHTQKMDYGLVHAMFVTRMPGFMPVVSQDRLWRELCDTRFTTPMLREWLPYIERRLKEMDILTLAESFNYPYEITGSDGVTSVEVMRCGVLEATTDKLDDIITDGLRGEHIVIPASKSNLDPTVVVADASALTHVVAEVAPEPEPAPAPVAEDEKPQGSWKIGCKIVGQADDDLSYNGCRYGTREKAVAAADNLYARWTMMRGYEIEASDDPANY